jgi:hypothetical protein
MLLLAKGNGCLCTPKGNGIKDGFVSWVCVYAVVFWMLRFPEAILHIILFFQMGCQFSAINMVTSRFVNE